MINFVEKIIVDASFEMSQEKGQAIRPFFHDLIRSAFPKAIDDVLSSKKKYQYKKYDQIHLDLGVISLENFQSKIIDALKSKLKEFFMGQEDIVLEPHQILLEILTQFLKEGNITSSAETLWRNYQYIFKEDTPFLQPKSFSIQLIIEELITHHREQFSVFFKQNIENSTILQRFILNVPEGILLELVDSQVKQIIRFFRTFYKTKSHTQIIENTLKLVIWQSVLRVLYQENAPQNSQQIALSLIKTIIQNLGLKQKIHIRKVILQKEISISPPTLQKEVLNILKEILGEEILTYYYSKKHISVQEFLEEFTNFFTNQEYIFIERFLRDIVDINQQIPTQPQPQSQPIFQLNIISKVILRSVFQQDFFEKEITTNQSIQESFVQNVLKTFLLETNIEYIFDNLNYLQKSQNKIVAQVSTDFYQKILQEAKKANISLKNNLLSPNQQKAIQTLRELMGLETPSVVTEKIALDILIQLLSIGAISPNELILLEKGEVNLQQAIQEILAKKKTLLREKLLTITNKPTNLALSQLKIYLSDDLIEILLEGIGKSLQKISKSRLKELKKQYTTPQYLFEEIEFLLENKVVRKNIEESLLFAYQNYEKELTLFIQETSDEHYKVLLDYKIDFIEHILQEDVRFIEQSVDLQIFYLTFFIRNKKIPENIASKIQRVEAFIENILILLAEKHPEKLQMILSSFVSKELTMLRKIAPKIIKKFYQKLTTEELVQKALEQRIKEKNTANNTASENQESKELPKKNKEIYIENPGLILVHPFINTLFRRLGYLNKKEFVDKDIQHRAVYLLQYIVDGNTEPKEEHQLILNKLLCGVPLREPLLTDIILSETEKETCESLLEGVIGNWTTLKNIKPANFRASFMKREAKLTDKFDFWELKVEATGVDVLLETLPWSIKIIVFPWMEKSINVDWS
ncbi:hypothetical protein AD998_08660 [bacterium 336/3]|nr:hypothetical protein AD998_08660 [bacterium 336/3]